MGGTWTMIYLIVHGITLKIRLLLGADAGIDINRAGAAVDLLHAGSAVAAGGIGSTVKLLTASTGAEDVALLGEGVSPLAGIGVSIVDC